MSLPNKPVKFSIGLLFILFIISCYNSKIYSQVKGKTVTNKHKANHLIHEKSPYLLQHAYNPVNWYPWEKQAFEKAKKENKPIFLSIGYSTCHWCHVMERESFEDLEVAKLLNEVFVCIKVDREERPDIDQIYMAYCMAVNKSGGWPLTILMTSEKNPFFAGTYFPKHGRFGRPGLMELIPKIQYLWKNKREDLIQNSKNVAKSLQEMSKNQPGKKLDQNTLNKAYQLLEKNFDSIYGGFGSSPKFPSPHNMLFLLRYWKKTKTKKALFMVEKTLLEMRQGGIFDQVGFGFHRYSTDHHWLLPHFEKMLYDQAMLSMAYVETYQATGKVIFKQTAEEIFTYVLRDMTDLEGGFYSAEDADSEGVEGKFYLWKKDEVLKILGQEDGEFFCKVFQIEKDGNFAEEASGHKGGHNIAHLKEEPKKLAKKFNLNPKEFSRKIENLRKKLFEVREKRVHPHKDDKILTDWNGLMIVALAKGGRVFGKKKYINAAKKSVDFILKKLQKKNGRLLHRYRKGESAIDAYLDDYVFLIWGLMELYESTFEVKYLEKAIHFQKDALQYFWDSKGGSFFFTASDGEKLLARPKEIYDGAIPSGNSVAMWNLLRLAKSTGNAKWEEKASQLSKAFSGRVNNYPAGYSQLMVAVDFSIGPTYEVVLVGDLKDPKTKKMIHKIYQPFIPGKVLVFIPSEEKDPIIHRLAEYTKNYKKKGNGITAYVCQNFSCSLPTSNIQKVLELLGEKSVQSKNK